MPRICRLNRRGFVSAYNRLRGEANVTETEPTIIGVIGAKISRLIILITCFCKNLSLGTLKIFPLEILRSGTAMASVTAYRLSFSCAIKVW